MTNQKTGLVLEGGALRGLFTAGVIDVFLENNICFDVMTGVSAGAAFGCNLKSKQPGRVLRYNLKYCKDKRYCSFRSLIRTGDMFGADFCYNRLPFELDIFDNNTFLENPLEFYAVCTDIETGKPVYYKCTDGKEKDLLYFRGSASMPLASKIVEVDGKKLLDGGIADPVPLMFSQKLGCQKNVVVLTQPKGYTKSKNRLSKLINLVYRKYPALCKICEERHEQYNSSVKHVFECEKNGSVFVIAPKKTLPIKRISHDADKIKETYELGRYAAIGCIDKIKEFIKK